MSATPAEAFDRLRLLTRSGELADFCREEGIDLLVAFGSVVDADRATTANDLDLAVLLDRGAATDVTQVVNALLEQLDCEDVDVLDLARAGPVAQEQALVGTVPLYERVPGTLANIRDRAIMLRMDTEWLRPLDVEVMASE